MLSRPEFSLISTNSPSISSRVRRHIAKSRTGAIISSILKSRYTELAAGVIGAVLVLGFWGTKGNVQSYIVDAAIARDGMRQDFSLQSADMGSVFMGGYGGSSDQTPAPTAGSTAIQDSTIVALAPSDQDFLDVFKADQLVEYSVQPGDTIGLIASNFGVSIDTIIWANNINNPNALSLGQTLKIPPVTGVIHTVKTGDTVASIASKYKADSAKILSFNNLTTDQALPIGNVLMVPGGEQAGPRVSVKPAAAKRPKGSGIYQPVGNGQCVDFVQAHGYSAMSGNANTWKRYVNTSSPAVGAAVVLRGGRYGHVALVTAVKPGSVQIVEQNYYGPYIIDHREISLYDKSIVGFIR